MAASHSYVDKVIDKAYLRGRCDEQEVNEKWKAQWKQDCMKEAEQEAKKNHYAQEMYKQGFEDGKMYINTESNYKQKNCYSQQARYQDYISQMHGNQGIYSDFLDSLSYTQYQQQTPKKDVKIPVVALTISQEVSVDSEPDYEIVEEKVHGLRED